MRRQLRIFLRSLSRKPVYSAVTLTGFTLAVAAGLLIYLWIYNESSFDRFHPGYRNIYRILTLSRQGDEIVKTPFCYRPVPRTLKMDYEQIEYATYISYSSETSPLQFGEQGEKIEAMMCWSDEDFFNVFKGFVFLEGSSESALKKPNDVILSEETAKRLFGRQPALGKTLVSDKYSKEVFTVSGVVRIPEQSHIDFGYMLSENNYRLSGYKNNWGDKAFVRAYIKLRRDAIINDQFIQAVTDHIGRYSNSAEKLIFQPLADIHLHSDYKPDFFDRNPGNFLYVVIFSGLAILIVLMASLNFSILSVARASERSAEIGLKKINGSSRKRIFVQFLLESVAQTFAATLTALLIVWLILPLFNSISAKELTLSFSPEFIFNLLLLTILTGAVAGIYPALYLSSFNPMAIFRGGTVSGSRTVFLRVMVTIQFTIAIFFIISISLLVKQLNYIQNKDLGIESENIISIPTGLWYDNRQFREELLKNPYITGVSASTYAPIDVGFRQGLPLNFQGRTDTLKVSYYFVDEDFAKTFGLEITKGQFLQMSSAAYWEETEKTVKNKKEGTEYEISVPVVINETAEKLLGFDDPVGQRLGNNVIVGVVKDFHFRSLHYPIEPLIMTNNPEAIMTMNVRIAPGHTAETIDYIRDVFMRNRDDREFSFRFFDDIIDEKYLAETRLKNITIAFGILAIVISILGILGMTVFSISRRTKEIGMRKVSGAESSEILILLIKEFMVWVIVAFFIASPVAWITMHKWLQNFVYKTDFSWLIFAFSGVIAIIIALVAITWQTWRAATRNPVEALRYE